MGRSISAPVIRFVIGANRIIGANPQALQGTVEDMRKSGSSCDEAAERPLGTRGGSVDQYATAIEIAPSARAGQGVNPLFQRARRIPALHGDFRHQCMRNAMQQDVGSAGILGALPPKRFCQWP